MTLKEFIINAGTTEKAYKLYEEAKKQGLTGASYKSYKRICRKELNLNAPKGIEIAKEGEVKRVTKPDGSIESDIRSSNAITTVEQMAKFCNINPDDFLPPKIVTNRWGDLEKPYWQFKVFWTPKYSKDELSPKQAMAEFKELMEDFSPNLFQIKKKPT